ncbi:acyl-CoA carboxylase epsilon subunit-like protein [Motilibacter peucedani]|uniref:Acyl-CoA carboxylase epsilon subunit-like protein n=1 Tax=Motilibacter peucedani TaxID=598650 RepID=A0A420XMG5_9ACTN|nr:acyl-CoA carboxylase subunit epsilon [Motilibacter peucedani]RKS71500.1 acyl-CoA carboxylase epsilon subunit-like protein [Motilibacter peucedani]
MSGSEDGGVEPVSVVRGDAEPEELAALVAVLVTRGQGARERRPAPTSPGWADRSALVRAPLRPGPGAWSRALR